MSVRREAFPSSSIGRMNLSNDKPDVGSSDSLSAHPLLSPTSSPAASVLVADTPTKYATYTPRQRHVTPSASASASTHSAVSVQAQQSSSQTTATGQLQLMNLRAAAQGIGIDTGTVGWAFLEKIVSEGDRDEWSDIWSSLATGKATLLLPLETMHSSDKITPDFVKDHVVLSDALAVNPVITLSGLRGDIVDDNLTIRSSLAPSSAMHRSVVDISTRHQSFSKFPPLPFFDRAPSSVSVDSSVNGSPTPRAATFKPPNIYPTFRIAASTPALPLPPKAPQNKPFSARAGARSAVTSASRFSSGFASLFGKSGAATSGPVSREPVRSSPTASLLSADDKESIKEKDGEPEITPGMAAVEINACAIDRKIVRKDVAKAVYNAIRSEVKTAMSTVPSWVADRVHAFSAPLYPFAKSHSQSSSTSGSTTRTKTSVYDLNFINDTVDQIADRFQEFYERLEEEMRAKGKKKDHSTVTNVEGIEDHHPTEPLLSDDVKIKDTMEIVERTLTSIFYDRLFSQPSSDDARHDEALSSRIAALNLVDLGLEHLDIDVGDSGEDIYHIVNACGESLAQLDAVCRCPADSSAVLIAVHKVVVDGLSRLPPIKLKERDDKSPEPPAPELPKSPPTAEKKLAEDLADALGSDSDTKEATKTEQKEPTPVSGDILLPIIIYAVVKSNPARLVSHLLYTQRFRNQTVGGEESYCLINLLAVVEFLENVDLEALGLGDSEKKVVSAADLTPIPVPRTGLTPDASAFSESLRGRVGQGVDALAGQAGKVIHGVVDTSFGVLKSIIPSVTSGATSTTSPEIQSSAPWNSVRPSFGLLRRESGFSIASLAASLPGAGPIRPRSTHSLEETGQQMISVSRPGSMRSSIRRDYSSDEGSDEDDSSDIDNPSPEPDNNVDVAQDERSIRSFESMLSGSRKEPRKSLSDRLSMVPGLSKIPQSDSLKGSPTSSRRQSLIVPGTGTRFDQPVPSASSSPKFPKIPAPNKKYLSATADDLRMSEVADLLREYKKLVDALHAQGLFEDA